jgi:ABC-type dipeptide/oligopeptide/nickel transport system permease subunit
LNFEFEINLKISNLGFALVVFAFNLLGDWLRDRLDPQLRSV